MLGGGSKNVLRQGDSNLSKRSSYHFSSSFNFTMTGLLHYLHFIWLTLNKTTVNYCIKRDFSKSFNGSELQYYL